MANTLTGLIPTLYESLDVVSRELVGFIPAVNTDHQADRAAVGQTILSPVAPAVTAADIVPGVTAPNDGDQTIGNVPITISKSRYVPIRWNGEETRGVNTGPGTASIIGQQFQQAFRTLSNEIEADLALAARQGASRAYGTAGTTPFGTAGDLTDFAGVRTILEDNGAPTNSLQLVGGSAAIGSLRGKQSVLFKASEAGSDGLLRTGDVGVVEGFAVRNSNSVRASIAKGTGASYTTTAAGFAVGTTSIPIITGTGTVLAGDVVTFAGDPNKYVVATGVAAPGTIVLAAPGLRQAIPAAATAMTIGNAFVPNVGFSRTAIMLASRQPALPEDLNGRGMDAASDRLMITDPASGLNFEVSLYAQYRQAKIEIALAWGVKVIKPEHCALLLG